MKITKSRLRQIIQEEYQSIIQELGNNVYSRVTNYKAPPMDSGVKVSFKGNNLNKVIIYYYSRSRKAMQYVEDIKQQFLDEDITYMEIKKDPKSVMKKLKSQFIKSELSFNKIFLDVYDVAITAKLNASTSFKNAKRVLKKIIPNIELKKKRDNTATGTAHIDNIPFNVILFNVDGSIGSSRKQEPESINISDIDEDNFWEDIRKIFPKYVSNTRKYIKNLEPIAELDTYSGYPTGVISKLYQLNNGTLLLTDEMEGGGDMTKRSIDPQKAIRQIEKLVRKYSL